MVLGPREFFGQAAGFLQLRAYNGVEAGSCCQVVTLVWHSPTQKLESKGKPATPDDLCQPVPSITDNLPGAKMQGELQAIAGLGGTRRKAVGPE